MTEQEINIAIAEACGWEYSPDGAWCKAHWKRKDELIDVIPNYYHDLNAMHEVEKLLDGNEALLARYNHELARLVTDMSVAIEDITKTLSLYLWHATARQRAEAFLRVVGSWRE